MNTYKAFAMVGTMLVLGSCSPGTSGGPGARQDNTTPASDRSVTQSITDNKTMQDTKASVLGPSDNTFTLDVPALATKLKQGETKSAAIGINRGKNMDQDVALKFSNLPTGVTISPDSPTIKHGEKEASIMVQAQPDAAIGDFDVAVVGHPSTGADATNTFKVSVESK